MLATQLYDVAAVVDVFLCPLKLASLAYLQAYIDIRTLRVHNIVCAPQQNPSAYLLHERYLYTSKNGSWQRARDYMADTVHSELLHYLCLANVRTLPFQISVTVDRDWFLLLPEATLKAVTYEDGIYSAQLATLADVEQVLGAMPGSCSSELHGDQLSYVMEKKPGCNSRMHDSHFFHLYLPLTVFFKPLLHAGDTICMSFHAARVHRGHIMWSTLKPAKRVRR